MAHTKHKWSKEEIEYLGLIVKGRYMKDIIMLMREKFNYNFTESQIRNAMKRNNLKTGVNATFKKGNNPWNKGLKFDKGFNSKDVGSEYVSERGYTFIKVENPSRWIRKHHYVYEQHYGKIEKDDCIIFADRDKTNFDINNLVKVTKAELAQLNKQGLIFDDTELTKAGIGFVKLKSKIKELEE